jgi:hypothetical protein
MSRCPEEQQSRSDEAVDGVDVGVPGNVSSSGWVCHECALEWLGRGPGKRCKRLIIKPLEPATTAENPRVGGSIPLHPWHDA